MEASGQLTSSLSSQPIDAPRKFTSKLVLKPGQNVQFYMPDSEEHTLHQATIVIRVGKSTGKYCNWYKIQFALPESKSGQATALDLGNVLELTVVEGSNSPSEMHSIPQLDENSSTSSASTMSPDDKVQEVMLTERICFDKAKSKELASWKEHDVFEKVNFTGQKCVSTRWICTMKNTADGLVPKARLVARGFEEEGLQEIPKDSPTCLKESLRLILAIVAQKGWKASSIDIKTAFLQGEELTCEVYNILPKKFKRPRVVWRLKKCVYGLSDASLYWYNEVRNVLTENGASVSSVDPAVFYWFEDNELTGVISSSCR